MNAISANASPAASGQRYAHRMLLADSDPLFLLGLRATLAADYLIESEVTTSEECLGLAPKADILLMGFSLACGRNALGLLPDLRLRKKELAVIVLLSPTTGLMASRLHAAGARGVLSRRTAPAEVGGLIRDAIQGKPLPPVLAGHPREASTAGSVDLSALTARELEIFRLIGLSKSIKDIAALLGISEKTVSAHRENLKSKLGLQGAGALRLLAIAHATWESTGTDHVI